MSKELFSMFLLLMPGILANEILVFLGKSKRAINLAYLLNSLIFSFVILGSNVLVKYLLGGGNEVFSLISNQYPTIFLVKYIALSMVFAVLYPFIFLMIRQFNQNWTFHRHEK